MKGVHNSIHIFLLLKWLLRWFLISLIDTCTCRDTCASMWAKEQTWVSSRTSSTSWDTLIGLGLRLGWTEGLQPRDPHCLCSAIARTTTTSHPASPLTQVLGIQTQALMLAGQRLSHLPSLTPQPQLPFRLRFLPKLAPTPGSLARISLSHQCHQGKLNDLILICTYKPSKANPPPSKILFWSHWLYRK